MAPSDSKSAKRKLLDSDDSGSDSDDGGAALGGSFKVNEEYARRFEHNKKREERQRLEEKYSKNNDNEDDDDESSSSDETEDEAGFLATEDLDAQISATLQAIRTKDPRVYDKKTTFYQGGEAEDGAAASKKHEKKEKPVYLQDYHREKLLRGDVGASDDEEDDAPPPTTYAQEQDALQKSIIDSMHAAGGDEDESDSDDGFMKRKEPVKADENGLHPSRAAAVQTKPQLDVDTADRDPDTFLSNFMTSRAWVPEEGSRWAAFESDDGDDSDGDRAETFEQAYNMRFEDPEKSNEVLKSYARDFTAARSVRREEKNSRKRHREAEREKKEEQRRQRKEEKARLRKLKLEEAEEKLRKVKQAAGAVGRELTDEEWMAFLDDAWENDAWEEEMKRRFGDEYYAMDEGADQSDNEGGSSSKKKHPKKPTWDDDIDIKDIVPDFDDSRPQIALDDDDNDEEYEGEDSAAPSKKRKTKEHKRARLESQKEARRERTKLEALVDSKLELTNHDLLDGPSSAGGFRYRETEPLSFGMTPRDILLAPSDAHLNEFAGLKKLAPFRPVEKRQRDAQRLSKKKRLRQWRRDTFGKEFEKEGPTYGFEKFVTEEDGQQAGPETSAPADGNVVGDVGGRKKRKRSKGKGKGKATTAAGQDE